MAKTSELKALIDAFILFAVFKTLFGIDYEIIVQSEKIKGEENSFFDLHNMPIAPNHLNDKNADQFFWLPSERT
jgi:hypothetical protein